MKSRTTTQFRKMFADLPEQVQEQTRKAYRQFKQDPSYPSLRFKKVHPMSEKPNLLCFTSSQRSHLSMKYHKARFSRSTNMTPASNRQVSIIRTERGLTISGTRITLYDVMDYLKAQYPPKFIRDAFNLTDEQIHVALSYIQVHQTAVEAEYQEILQTAEETRQYWEQQNRERFARIAAASPSPGYEAVRAKLQERKAHREAKKQ